ncbi:MAG: hypothetical protein KBD78_12665 [Oligoflexales bacterium]|nr:hypothetical protein [Oligoflexales bacterium]
MKSRNGSRAGRVFKKGKGLIEKISLLEYNFDELLPEHVLQTDNIDNSIIHTRLHDPQKIEIGSRLPESFNAELIDRNNRPTVILPRDFTDDWNKQKQRSFRARNSLEEEEEFETEAPIQNASMPTESKPIELLQSDLQVPLKIDESLNSEHNEHLEDLKRDSTPYSSLDLVGKVIKNLAPSTKESEIIQHTVEETESLNEKQISPFGETSNHVQNEKLLNENRDKIISLQETAKADGYLAGFKEGESKGLAQIRQISSELFQHLNQVIEDLEGLKKDILTNAQDNFFEITQALGEAILNHEFNLNPIEFKKLTERAIARAIQGDEYTIRASRSAIELLKKTADQKLMGKIQLDPHLKDQQFAIDSKIGNVHVDLNKIIRELLESADINLFDDAQTKNVAS